MRRPAVVALDAVTGTPLWKSGSEIHGGVYGAPMVVNGQLFAGAMDGKLYAFGL
jgi:outer membrane protein assembly factor BamB